MLNLPYSLVIEATEETDFFGFYSPDLEGFSGKGGRSAQTPLPGDRMYVRISKGRYAPDLHSVVSERLAASATMLIPAIRRLPGCASYYVGADAASGTMINVSVWDTLEHAQAMSDLPEMLALAGEFIALGVEFERPIINYPVMWQVKTESGTNLSHR